MKKTTKLLVGIISGIVAMLVGVKVASNIQKKQNKEDTKNPFEGKKVVFIEDASKTENADGMKGYLQAVGETKYEPSFYDKYIKRGIDIILAFSGIVVLSPVLLGIALAIKIDDPGPVFFTQKRLGQNKKYFRVYKFRSMKMSTPHDTPTHMLDDPDQYITKVGKFLRAHSLDELPQLFNVLDGSLSLVGPRPGLWNQDILTAERDKYGVNEMKPGITGWAQINGRDSISIEEKAKLDGYWKEHESFLFDLKCLLGTVLKVGHDDSAVEGGTGAMGKKHQKYTDNRTNDELIGKIGFSEPVEIDRQTKKKVLITGAGSYIGQSFINYAKKNYPDNFEIEELDLMETSWKNVSFSKYDIVYHVAGIAHADVGKVSEETKEKYYKVNTDLTVEVAKKAKEDGVREFIFMSSMIIYGESAPYGKKKVIDENTVPMPANFYGDSKLQADVAVRTLADEKFKVIVLRPPMIYGKGSKGNYPILAKIARKLPVFPNVNNERSMLHIDNLCEFLCQILLVRETNDNAIVLIPQNAEWINTSAMVKEIANVSGKNIIELKVLKPAVIVGSKIPGKIGGMVNKAFGNNCYAHNISVYSNIDYQKITLKESIKLTEKSMENTKRTKKKVLMLASVASMIDQFNMSNIDILLKIGYDVDVACNFGYGSTCSDEKIVELKAKLKEKGIRCFQIDFTRSVMNLFQDGKAYKQVRKLVENNKYDLIHCHSPIGGVIGRIVAHETNTKVIYTAHGFHFYEGGPKKNWFIYYPIEKALSKWTDVLITINKEDYNRAKKKFFAKETRYIPGVGVDVEKFEMGLKNKQQNKKIKRAELGVSDNDFVLLSVGELQDRKNQRVVIEALHMLNNPNIYYWAVGKGELFPEYLEMIKKYGLEKNVFLLGFRTDIMELCNAADCFVHPSVREGLGIAPLEAMAGGLPLISSYVNGIKDYTENEVSGCCIIDPLSVTEMKKAIEKMYQDVEFRNRCGINNLETVKKFDIKNTNNIMQNIYYQFL